MTATHSWGLLIALLAGACSPSALNPPTTDLGAASDRPETTVVDAVVSPDVPMVTGCSTDRDCTARGMVCEATTAQCVQCNGNGDCAAPLACLRHACQAVVHCTGSTMCPGQVCSTTLGVCVDCNIDRECAATQMCTDGACVERPPACSTDRDCTSRHQVCDVTAGHCVACNADGDCVAGHYCNAAHACVAQTCVPGQTTCADATHTQTCDVHGASSTMNACATGQSCRAGSCMTNVCTPGATLCDATTHDRVICNVDGSATTPMPCPSGQTCNGGSCMACVPGTATCSDANTRQVCNSDGLGTTPMVCASMQRCNAGVCQTLACTPGSSTCVDAHTVRVCSDGLTTMMAPCSGTSTCSGGMCAGWVCTPGTATCASGTTRSVCNADGLGSATTACLIPNNASASACTGAGVCTFTCNTGFGDCNAMAADGCETTLATSAANCGSCGHACLSGQSCAGGTCRACVSGERSCASGSNAQVCNGDGMGFTPSPCPLPAHAMATTCTGAGVCGFTCAAGWADCDGSVSDGCELDVSADPMNCGACGNRCSSGTCGSSVSTSSADPPAGWTFNGSTVWNATAGSIMLTRSLVDQAGTAYFGRALTVDQFTVRFDFRISGGTGDGLAFVLQRTGATAVGGHGGGLGAVGLDGLAAELDVYPNPGCGDSAPNQAAISTLAVCNGPDGMLLRQLVGSSSISPALNNGAWRSASVSYNRGTMTITVDGVSVIEGYAIPGAPVGTNYWFGFSAGTGANPAQTEVRNVVITFPSPRCL